MELFYRNTGKGPAFVILHGLYGASDNWLGIAGMLKDQFELFIPDMRNHGQSPKSDNMYYSSMREDILQLFEKCKIEKAILLGHSMGGRVAIDFALNYPEKISHLIVGDISPRPYNQTRNYKHLFKHHQIIIDKLLELPIKETSDRKELAKLLQRKLYDERLVNFLLKNLKRDDNKEFYWTVNLEVLKENLQTILAGIGEEEISRHYGTTGFPVLFLRGSLSSYLTEDDTAFIEQLFPYAEIEEIPDAGHWLHAEQPEIFIEKVKRFVFG